MMPDPKLLFRIDRQSKIPLYNLIEQNFHELILSGQLKPGDAIPSEWDLATVYGVSRLTVRHALDNLARQGWLSRRHGVGTFIANPTVTRIAPSNLSFSEQMRAVGRRPSSRLVSIQVMPAGGEVAGHLRLQESEPVVEITRLRLADDEPILLETSYLSQTRFPGLENATSLTSGSLYEYLATQYQVHVVEMDQTLEPVILSESEARYLETPTGSPAVLSEVIAYTYNGDPIEYCWSVTRGDKCKFYFHFRRGDNTN